MTLTREQIQLFSHNGFIKLPEPLPDDTVSALKETIWRDIRDVREPVVRDAQGRIVRISKIWEREPIFRETLAGELALDPLESLLGPNIELLTNRHNHATLRLAEDPGDYFHRDILQWTRSIVTIIFYLEETTVENGCTLVVPGTHLLPGLQSLKLSEDPLIAGRGILEQAVPVPMPAGGMLAINSLVLHAPGRNQTNGTRISMTAGYHSMDELSNVENPKRVLVRGRRIYMGNS